MKCNEGTDLVCTYWDKCQNANICENVPKGIRRNLNIQCLNNESLYKKLKQR